MIFTVDSPIAHKLVVANVKGHQLPNVYSFDTETRKAIMYKRDERGKLEFDSNRNPIMVEQILDAEWFLCTREYYKFKFTFIERFKKDEKFQKSIAMQIIEAVKGQGEPISDMDMRLVIEAIGLVEGQLK